MNIPDEVMKDAAAAALSRLQDYRSAVVIAAWARKEAIADCVWKLAEMGMPVAALTGVTALAVADHPPR